MTKTCPRCLESKASDSFYANDNTCKVCRCAMVRANRARRVEYYRAYERGRASTPKRLEHLAANTRRYRAKNADRYAAHIAVGNAIRDGVLKPEPCVVCKKPAHAHHEDYSKPLAVIWLCPEHHHQYHLIRRIAVKVTGDAS